MPLDEVQLSTWRPVQAVNVESALLLMQAFVPGMGPEDTAAVVAMLVRDDAAARTGQTITVDGGLILR